MLIFALMSTVQAQSSQETLNQYISDLQKNPNDNALREKIIKHVQTINTAPAISEDAKRYMARGKAASKGAKEAKDFNEAAEEFKKALLAAPWLAEGYYNLGIVQDKAGQHSAAMESLKLYVIAAPNASDMDKVKELIYEIEYRKEKAAKESSPAAVEAKQQNKAEEFLKRLNGARYVKSWQDICSGWTLSININGDEVDVGETQNWKSDRGCNNETIGYYLRFRCRIVNKKMQGDDFIFEFDNSNNNWMYKSITISGGGNTLTLYDKNSSNPMVYTRQR